MRFVMSGNRSVDHAAGGEQPPLAVGLHDERVVAVEVRRAAKGGIRSGSRCAVDREVGHVLARPLPGLLVPPHILLAFRPGSPIGGRGGTVVEHAPVRRPCPRPFGGGLVLFVARFAAGGHVLASCVDAGVDPAASGRGAVVGHLVEVVERLTVAFSADEKAVDLPDDRLGVDFALVIDRVVPGHVEQRPVAGVVGVLELLAHGLAEFIEEVEFALCVPGRVDGLVAPLHETLGLRERAGFLRVVGCGQEEHLGVDVLGIELPGLDLGAVLPPGGGFDEAEVAHNHPLQVAHRHALHAPVGRAHGRVLPEQEVAVDAVVEHAHRGLVRAVGAVDARQIVEGEVVVSGGRIAPPGLEQAGGVGAAVGPVALVGLGGADGGDVVVEGVVDSGAGHRQVAGQQVEQGRDVGRSLDRRVPAQGHDSAARATHIAQQELEDRGGADELCAEAVLGPADRVGEARGPFPARVLGHRFKQVVEVCGFDSAVLLDHLRRVARVVVAQDLEDRLRVLQARVLEWSTVLVRLVRPRRVLVGARVRVESGEQSVEVLGVDIVVADEVRGVGVGAHVFVEVPAFGQDTVDERTEQHDVGAGPDGHMLIGDRGGARETRVDVDDAGTPGLGFGHPLEAHGVALGHIGTLDDDAVRIRHILDGLSGAAAPERGSQTGNRGGVSNTRLVLDLYRPGRGVELLGEVVLLVVDGRPAEAGDAHRPPQRVAFVVEVLPVVAAGFDEPVGDHVDRGRQVDLRPVLGLRGPVEDVGDSARVVDELFAGCTLRA